MKLRRVSLPSLEVVLRDLPSYEAEEGLLALLGGGGEGPTCS